MQLDWLGNRLGIYLEKSTLTAPMREATASVIADAIDETKETPVLWNAFPYHPYDIGNPASNRCHTRAEIAALDGFAARLVELVQPQIIVAIGVQAAEVLHGLGLRAHIVRHPSYGGIAEFRRGIREIYG